MRLKKEKEKEKVCGEGRSPEITVATRKEAREPKMYILLGVGQTIGVLSHVPE